MALSARGKWFSGALVAAGIAFSAGVVGLSGGDDIVAVIDAGELAPSADAGGGQEEINLAATWTMHTIKAGANGAGQADGADGIQWADFDGDGLLDAVVGHEQGLRVTLSFNPGGSPPADNWPTVILPSVNLCSPEDVVPSDVDADGRMDIVYACETGSGRVGVFYAPTSGSVATWNRTAMLTAANWVQVPITAADANARWMRVAITDIAGTSAKEIVAGGKEGASSGQFAALGYFSSATPRTGASWTFTEITRVGWVMNMYVQDLDGDSDKDIVYTDRDPINEPSSVTTKRGLRWLKNLGGGSWQEIQISPIEGQHKWFTLADWDGDSDYDILDCRSNPSPSYINSTTLYVNGGNFASFTTLAMSMPSGTGLCQHATVVDVDEDGALDIGWSFSNATALEGVAWARRGGTSSAPGLLAGKIAGQLDADSDTKFDNLEWVDVDGDGDLDATATEQHIPGGTGPGLGVLWFENPLGEGGPALADAGVPDAAVPDAAPPGGSPIACTLLTSGTDVVSGTTAVTSSVTPGANRVVYAAFLSALASGPAAPSGVTGNGLTWVQEETTTFHTTAGRRLTVFRALGASPSAGAITATWGASQTAKLWSVVECANASTGGTNGSTATVQSVPITSTTTPGTTYTNTLSALTASTSVHLAFGGISINNAHTPDADFAELSDNQTATGVSGLEAQWATNQTAVTPTFSSANYGGISIEVRAP